MFNAITTLLSKTIDVYLYKKSSDSRRHELAKDLFEVYQILGEVISSIERIEDTIRSIGQAIQKKGDIGDNLRVFVSSHPRPAYLVIESYNTTPERSGEEHTFIVRTRYLGQDGSEKSSDTQELTQVQMLSLFGFGFGFGFDPLSRTDQS